MTNRREFLKLSSLVGLGATVPTFLARTAFAAPDAAKPGAKDTILVVVQLTGGNDGLNTVVPFKDELYAKYRPTIKLPTDQLKKINDSIGLHPSLDGLAGLLEDKSLCVVQGVGYPNPSQSHFRSMDIWQAASTAETLTEGWVGKALKAMNVARVPRRGQQRIGAAGAERLAGPRAVDYVHRGLPAQARGQGRKRRDRKRREGRRQARPARLRSEDRAEHVREQPEASGDRQELRAEGPPTPRPDWPTG